MVDTTRSTGDFPYSSGMTLVDAIYRGVSGYSECAETAKQIVESLDRDALTKFVTEILYGVEIIKNNERGRAPQVSFPQSMADSLRAIYTILEQWDLQGKRIPGMDGINTPTSPRPRGRQ